MLQMRNVLYSLLGAGVCFIQFCHHVPKQLLSFPLFRQVH